MKRLYSLLFAFALLSNISVFAMTKTLDAGSFLSTEKGTFKLQNTDKNYSVMELNTAILSRNLQTANNIIINDFPTATDVRSSIRLERTRQVFDQNTKFLTQTENGEVYVPAPNCEMFKGKIVGDDNSEVMFIYMNNSLFCSINSGDGSRFFMGPYKGSDNEVMLVNEADFYKGDNFGFQCNVGELKQSIGKNITDRVMSNKLLELEVALETDSEFFVAAGGTLAKAQTYAMAMFSLISAIYEKELNITIYIPWYKCWTNSPSDPYQSKGNPFVLNDKASAYWKANYSNVQRDIFHVMTAISYGGGGFGYFDALCGNKDFGYATSSVQVQSAYPTFTFTYDVYIVAHEMGHNLNGQHTHSCYWGYPLDTCMVDDAKNAGCLDKSATVKPNPGSIMSYCGGANNSFGLGYQVRMIFLPQNQTIMRQTAEAAACITEPPNPKVAIKYPNGGETLQAVQPVDIQFNTARVSKINIMYSIDNGATWIDIVKDYNTASGKYTWTTPDLCLNSLLLQITDASNKSVADTSILPISIYKTKPTELMGKYYFDGDFKNAVCGGFADAISLEGGVSTTTDRFGLKDSAIALNGTGYLMIPQADLTNNALSVSLWFNASDLSTKRFMIGTNYGPAINVFEIYYWGLIGCSYYMKEGLWQVWGSGASTNTWYHVVYTYDGNNAKVYVNGALVKTDSKTGTLVPFNTVIYIGSRKGNEPFMGKLDDIRIYRTAITAQEVQAIFTDKRAPQSPELLAPKDKFETMERDIKLQWVETELANSYQVQLASNTFFGAEYILKDTIIKETSFDFKIKEVGEYFWRVKAVNPFGLSSWALKRSFKVNASAVEDKEQIAPVILFQSEPNPSSGKIKIRFDLNLPLNAELIIFDQVGVKKSINLGNLSAGSHSVDYDFSAYPSGVYFYSLKTELGTITKKLEIVK